MKNSKLAAVAVLFTSLAGAAPALAQKAAGFGRDGQFILSAERLFGLMFTKQTTETTVGVITTTTNSRTDITLLWPAVTPNSIHEQCKDRKSTRLNSSHSSISYAVFCLKKKKKTNSTLTPSCIR